MLKTHVVSPSIVALVSVAVILVIALGAAAYLRQASPALPISAPVVNPVVENPVQPPADAANPIPARSFYVSEATLRSRLEAAYDDQDAALVQMLQAILNDRYEHRCCGLPR